MEKPEYLVFKQQIELSIMSEKGYKNTKILQITSKYEFSESQCFPIVNCNEW